MQTARDESLDVPSGGLVLHTGKALARLWIASVAVVRISCTLIGIRFKVIPAVRLQVVSRNALQIVYRVRCAAAQHKDVLAIINDLVTVAPFRVVSHLRTTYVYILPYTGAQIQTINITSVIKSRRSADCVEEVLVDHYSRSVLSRGQVTLNLEAIHARCRASAGRSVNVTVVGAGYSKWITSAAMRLKE